VTYSRENLGAESEKGPLVFRATEKVAPRHAAAALAGATEIAAANSVAESEMQKGPSEATFANHNGFWGALLQTDELTENSKVHLTENSIVTLNNFVLTEWLPLRPGLFHTREAGHAREEAIANCQIRQNDEKAPLSLRRLVRSLVGQRAESDQPFVRIFNPDGKLAMINGGIGCIRLKPLASKEVFRWAMGAASNGIVHEGLIVALNNEQHDRLIGDILKRGGLRCEITGRLRFVATNDPLANVFERGIPQLLLEARSVEPLSTPDRYSIPRISVTAVVTFTSEASEYEGLNASYVTFCPSEKGAINDAADWLERIYVKEAYKGQILTDFDEQTRRFRSRSVTFSLDRLLNGLVDRNDARQAFREVGLDEGTSQALEAMMDRRGVFVVINRGNVGTIVNVGQVSGNVNLLNPDQIPPSYDDGDPSGDRQLRQ
jgi:hypothetical protein